MREIITQFDLNDIPVGVVWKANFNVVSDGLGYPICIPLMVAKGHKPGPVLGLTAVVHGNEINGLPVIQRVFQNLDLDSLCGIVIGLPVLNVPGFLRRHRRFNDNYDLNQLMPGKANGNRSAIYAHRIVEKIVSKFHYLIDLHTASFGRVNSYYARGDMSHPIINQLTILQGAQIILDHKGKEGTLRRAAMDKNIPSITVELRDPHIFQKDVIQESVTGIFNVLTHLNMQAGTITSPEQPPLVCKKSYWIYTDQGGLLEVFPKVAALVKKGDRIARVRDAFGDVLKEYTAPEDGVVIGKSIDPVNQTGGRILHLGIM